MAISPEAAYSGCLPVGTILYPGDTWTSPNGAYVIYVTSSGFVEVFNKDTSNEKVLVPGLIGVTSVRITATGIIFYATNSCKIGFPIVAVKVCLENTGQVVAYDAANRSFTVFSFNADFVVVSQAALAAFEQALKEAIGGVQAKLQVLQQSARPAAPEFLDNPDDVPPPKQSGFPGPNDAADEKVA